jgi:hypothetical protein
VWHTICLTISYFYQINLEIMRKFFLLFSFIAIATAGVLVAQDQTPAEKIVFEKVSHDFGTLKEGDPAMEVFKFKNVSSEPVTLQNVKASCGCTTPQWTNTPVAPGATGEIQVSYGTTGRPGAFNKSVTVTLDTVSQPIFLYIKGDVIRPEVPTETPAVEPGHEGHNHAQPVKPAQPVNPEQPKHSMVREYLMPSSYQTRIMATNDVKFNRLAILTHN